VRARPLDPVQRLALVQVDDPAGIFRRHLRTPRHVSPAPRKFPVPGSSIRYRPFSFTGS
jgi:hypothetical protein